jgi:hypothetical protein
MTKLYHVTEAPTDLYLSKSLRTTEGSGKNEYEPVASYCKHLMSHTILPPNDVNEKMRQ